ncbi:unnamed protein product [Brachionus calyciflorus]|uniref:HTH CENPB-type domain-containing protein n=1 Tax=Brachionus calyciflorus TaxID=104777 RepID=A0A814JTV2_9BILA|nr:unnamed protein product [Brachionus calyciflorus]
MTAKNRRLNAGYSRSSNFENLEDELKIWITETRNSGACVSGKLIQTKALEMSVRHGVNDRFKASQGWLRNFLRRNNLVLRRITSKGRSLPQNSIETINQFISKCADETSGVNKDEIYSMDETTIYLDSPSNYTYETRGANRINAKTAGCEKTRLSLAFGASAKGSKLPLVILIPRKRPLKDFEPPSNVIVVYKKSATFDATTVKNGFVQRSLLPTIMRKGQRKPRLYLDSATCHKKAELTSYLADLTS